MQSKWFERLVLGDINSEQTKTKSAKTNNNDENNNTNTYSYNIEKKNKYFDERDELRCPWAHHRALCDLKDISVEFYKIKN